MQKLILALISTVLIFTAGCATKSNICPEPVWPSIEAVDELDRLGSQAVDTFLQDLLRLNDKLEGCR